MMSLIALFGFSLILSGVAIRIGIPLSQHFGVVDRPGGHKLHDHITPFVGGIGVFVALLGTLVVSGQYPDETTIQWLAVAASASIMFITGLIDDIRHLSFKIRFLIQGFAALVMIFGGGVVLSDLGQLASGAPLELGVLAIPFTVFATIGVINAMNMIDGIDGLSGSVSLVSLLLLSMVALAAGATGYTFLAVGLLGGAAGFLYFNLRYQSQRRARVFLGDNGSMLLGFLFSWMLIALSQQPIRVITPVTALWLFSIPLMDTLGVMLRRIWLGKSPFRPDRHHLHHLFIRAGFRVQDVVYAIAMIHLTLGVTGIVGMQMGMPDHLMLLAFLMVFAAYFYLILRPWRFVPTLRSLHTLLELSSPETRGIYLGNCALADAQSLIAGLSETMKSRDDYRLNVYQAEREGRKDRYVYAVLELLNEDTESSMDEIKNLVEKLKRRFKRNAGIRIRQFRERSDDNDRRVGEKHISQNYRGIDRRSQFNKILVHTAHGTGQPIAAMA